jgi:hypothetical protein
MEKVIEAKTLPCRSASLFTLFAITSIIEIRIRIIFVSGSKFDYSFMPTLEYLTLHELHP